MNASSGNESPGSRAASPGGQPGGQPGGHEGASVARAHPPSGGDGRQALDEVIYEGRARHSTNVWNYTKWVLLSMLGGAIHVGFISMDWLPDYSLYLSCLWLIGIPGLFVSWLIHRSKRFKVSRRRIEIESGVLSRRVDSLELWRVLDVRYEQSLLDRMLGNGKITLIGTDQTDSTLRLYGLPRHREVFETLRDAVQLARHSNRPIEFVPGQDFEDGIHG